jgi:hypothetical protein
MKTKSVECSRTRAHFEQAIKNANCPLFEQIARWVIQDEGYVSMNALVNRIKELESYEKQMGIIPSKVTNQNYERI